jgi:hypothetical protein
MRAQMAVVGRVFTARVMSVEMGQRESRPVNPNDRKCVCRDQALRWRAAGVTAQQPYLRAMIAADCSSGRSEVRRLRLRHRIF